MGPSELPCHYIMRSGVLDVELINNMVGGGLEHRKHTVDRLRQCTIRIPSLIILKPICKVIVPGANSAPWHHFKDATIDRLQRGAGLDGQRTAIRKDFDLVEVEFLQSSFLSTAALLTLPSW